MFKKLRNRIIIITMTITTAILIVAGSSVVIFSSTIRPEPKPLPNSASFNTPDFDQSNLPNQYSDRELQDFIRSDRKEGNTRLLVTLLSVGVIVEIVVFVITYYLSGKIVAPVKNSYDKQKMFIANASHELKTPLAVIQANMEALDVDEENKKWKDNIENEINHANKLVLNLLQLAKMDAGSLDKKTEEKVDLADEIKKRIEMFEAKFTGKISFKVNTDSAIYNLPKQDILQIMDILLDNATKYGKRKIYIVLNRNSVVISNDGATIQKSDTEKVFDRFYQTDKTKEGSGLGLAIAKALCEQNNWQISCDSEKGMTKFIVRF